MIKYLLFSVIDMFENNKEKEKLGSNKFIQNLQNDGDIEQAIGMFAFSPKLTQHNNSVFSDKEVRTW